MLRLPDLDPLFAAELARRAEDRAKVDREDVLDECRRLSGFIRNAWHILEPTTPYVWSWHVDAICDHLEAVADGNITRLLINIPPGTMKSLLVSVFFPAWLWGPANRPGMRFLATSYEKELVLRDNGRMRDLVTSDWYQGLWGDRVELKSRAIKKFSNTAQGGREGRPFGSMTGGRGDIVLIDDPHSVKTAESSVQRKETVRLMRESIPNRVNDPIRSAIILIMQRLNEEDCSAVAIEQGFVHLRLPMEFEVENACETVLGPGKFFRDPRTFDGELLTPERYPRREVERDKRILREYAWAGQYQQRPAPREGAMIDVEKIEVVKMAPRLEKSVRGWDLASTQKKLKGSQPDWTAGVRVGRGPDGYFYVVDARRFQERPGAVRQKIKATASQDGGGVYITVPQDPAQAGVDQVEQYAKELAGYMVKARRPSVDKEMRAEPFAAMVDLGMVRIVQGPWNEAYLHELKTFPAGKNDDQVDATSDAFNELTGIVPGEGLLEFYRQEAERIGAEGAPPAPLGESKDGLIALVPAPGISMAFGMSGESYRPREDGMFWVRPEDKGLMNATGWSLYVAPLAED